MTRFMQTLLLSLYCGLSLAEVKNSPDSPSTGTCKAGDSGSCEASYESHSPDDVASLLQTQVRVREHGAQGALNKGGRERMLPALKKRMNMRQKKAPVVPPAKGGNQVLPPATAKARNQVVQSFKASQKAKSNGTFDGFPALGIPSWNAGYGLCDTYAGYNKDWCDIDQDQVYGLTASMVCKECGKSDSIKIEFPCAFEPISPVSAYFDIGYGDCSTYSPDYKDLPWGNNYYWCMLDKGPYGVYALEACSECGTCFGL